MLHTLGVTATYAGLSAIALLIFTVFVVRGRLRSKCLTGYESDQLYNANAAQNNFSQYLPIGLILLLLMEIKGLLSPLFLHAWAATFLLSRILNAGALLADPRKPFKSRVFGFQLTALLMLSASGLLLFHGVHDSIVKPAVPTIRAGYNAAEDYSSEALQAVHSYTQDAMRLADSYAREAVDRALAAGNTAYDTAAGVGKSTIDTAAGLGNNAYDATAGVGKTTYDTAADLGNSAYDTAADAASVAADKASGVYGSAAKLAKDAYKSAEGLVKGATDTAADTASGASAKAKAAARDASKVASDASKKASKTTDDASKYASATAKTASRQADQTYRDAAKMAQDASTAAYDNMNAAYRTSQDKLQEIYDRVRGVQSQPKQSRFNWGWIVAALVTAGMLLPFQVVLNWRNTPAAAPTSGSDKAGQSMKEAVKGTHAVPQVGGPVKGTHAVPQVGGPINGAPVGYSAVPTTEPVSYGGASPMPGTTTGQTFQATSGDVKPMQRMS